MLCSLFCFLLQLKNARKLSCYCHWCANQLVLRNVIGRRRRRRTLPRTSVAISIALLCGVTLAFAAFFGVRAREQREIQTEFQLTSENFLSAVKREIEANLAVLRSLTAFVEVSGHPDRLSFETYARHEQESHPTVLALEWMPRVKDADRAAYERQLSLEERRTIQIRGGSSSNPKPEAPRSEYFPITRMYPRMAALQVLGFDSGEQKSTADILDQVRDTGEPRQTNRFRLVEKTVDGFGVPVFLPVYRPALTNGSLEERRQNLAGYTLVIFEVAAVLEKAVGQLNPLEINIQFYDLSSPAGKRLLHFHPAASERNGKPLSETEALTPADFRFSKRFNVAAREWAMVCTPSATYLSQNRTWQPWWALLMGLAGTFAIGAYVSLSSSYAAQVTRLNEGLEQRVSERTEALRQSDERYALAALGSKDGLWDWNLVSDEVYYSERWKNMLGYSADEISSDPEEWLKRVHPDDLPWLKDCVDSHLTQGTPHLQSEHRIRHRDGSYRWMLCRGVAVFDEAGRATRMAGSQTDVTAGKLEDPLTGLSNRLFLIDKLDQAIERMRSGKSPLFAFLFLDLDRFKLVNDSLGHAVGDRLLVSISERLKDCAYRSGLAPGQVTLARLGGDEFGILLDPVPDLSLPTMCAEKLLADLRPVFDLNGHQVFASCSIGVALGSAETNPEDVLRDADTAMYHAKSRGKQRYELFTPVMRERAVARLNLETDLRGAVERGELRVHYQPKVSLVTGQTVGFEAVVRWHHPLRGLVFPRDFISMADETGLVVPIGAWVLREACEQLAVWRATQAGRNFTISVNLSARQFDEPGLLQKMRSILDAARVPAEALNLEITESIVADKTEEAIAVLNQVRAMGIRLSIDDFGTGFSSLSYLHRLPFCELKIDQSFVAGIGQKKETTQIVRTIILLARSLEMSVVAEGVETQAQLDELISLGCNYAQGYLFAPPVPADSAMKQTDFFARVLAAD